MNLIERKSLIRVGIWPEVLLILHKLLGHVDALGLWAMLEITKLSVAILIPLKMHNELQKIQQVCT